MATKIPTSDLLIMFITKSTRGDSLEQMAKMKWIGKGSATQKIGQALDALAPQFEVLRTAWSNLHEYEPPPCPSNAKIDRIAAALNESARPKKRKRR